MEMMVPGGRVELPTPAFSGPRSTGELPRHGAVRYFTGDHGGIQGVLEARGCTLAPANAVHRRR
jgi:hypothetical protein